MHFIHIHLQDDKACHWYTFDQKEGHTATKCVLFAEAVRFDMVIETMQVLLHTYKNIFDLSSIPCDNARLTPAQKRLLHLT